MLSFSLQNCLHKGENWTYSAPGGDGHILQLILPVVSKAWSFDCYHLQANLQPAK